MRVLNPHLEGLGTAVVFPGQGCQYVGMGATLAALAPVVADTLAEADEVLGLPLAAIIATGPPDRLSETAVAQPAILAVSVAMWRLLVQVCPEMRPVAAAGHSLGEYSALVASGSLDYADALRIVHLRGRIVEGALEPGTGAMVAILGLDRDTLVHLCAQAAQGRVLEPACWNAPGQGVVAGHADAVERLEACAREAGASTVVRLRVSAPFHTSLLSPAGAALGRALGAVRLRPPGFPVVQNVDASARSDPERIRAGLVAQVSRPVRWEECVRTLVDLGAVRVVEVGPGATLCGLVRRIDRRLSVVALDRFDWDALQP
ncbi:MAG: ACP S-malonyltransferase [Deltaproteobacteria bacterium]|nr:ACP S-malonyltransferase [Deltaproteobacteria bacterium]